MKQYRALMADPMQRRLLGASIPADFSDWLDYVAIVTLLVYGWQQGPVALAFFAFALGLPYVALGPLLAPLVDRSDLRFVLIASNLGRAAATLALVFASDTVQVLLIVFVRATIDSVFTPARQAAIQALTPPEQLMAANGLHQGVNQVSKIAGPALGGLLLVLLPIDAVFGLNAIASLLAAAILVFLRIPRPAAQAKDEERFWPRITAGLREFGTNRRLTFALLFVATAFFAFFLYDTLIALLAADFGYDQVIYGLSVTASGLGGIIGSIAAGALANRRPLALMGVGALLSGSVTAMLGLAALGGQAVSPILFLASLAVMGGAAASMMVPYRSIIQAQVAQDRIARVYAAGEAIIVSAMLSAPFLGSAIADHYGIGAPFLLGGALIVLIGLMGLVAEWRR